MTEENIKYKPQKNKKLMLVRYGKLGHLGWFEHEESQIPKVHSKVLIKTERGLELGDIVGRYCYKAGNFRLTAEKVDQYLRRSGDEQPPNICGEFVRFATSQDINEFEHLKRDGQSEMEVCIRIAGELNVPIDIVDVEHIFGGERIIFYFIAESRVDFRELVRVLAKEYQTRIEMRQIGSRDEARLMSDYETCGRECCCSQFMRILKPVNMRMAKLQKATLDPSKISGYCGRLKCCLRYEDDTYRVLRDTLPKRNTPVRTPHGNGYVVDVQILTQLVIMRTQDGRQIAVPVEEVEEVAMLEDLPVDTRSQRGEHRGRGNNGERRQRPEDRRRDEACQPQCQAQCSESCADQQQAAEQEPEEAAATGGDNAPQQGQENRTGRSTSRRRRNRRRNKNPGSAGGPPQGPQRSGEDA